MAGKSKFRIPSLKEMEKPDEKLSVFSTRKQDVSLSADSKTEAPNSSEEQSRPKPPAVPPQRNPLEKVEAPTSASVSTTAANDEPKTCPANSNLSKSDSAAKSNPAKLNEQMNPSTVPEIPAKRQYTNSIVVNTRQRGNPILKGIRNVPWEFGNIVPDYEMGKATCALFLSLRYHQLHPEYIHTRLKSLGKSYDLRVLLVQVDVKDPHHLLKDVSKMCILADCTLILAFSPEEAGRYLETYKVYENKPPEMIMEKSEHDYMSKLTDCLTSVKSVNKTDCVNLISSFKSLEAIMNSSRESLSFCPGLGPRKAQRLYEVFHEPFIRKRKRTSNEHTEDGSPKKSKKTASS